VSIGKISDVDVISNSQEEREVINLGEAVYLSADAKTFSLTGSGEAYLAISSN